MKLNKLILTALLISGAVNVSGQRFAILSDIHVTPGNACDSMLRVAVSEINDGK